MATEEMKKDFLGGFDGAIGTFEKAEVFEFLHGADWSRGSGEFPRRTRRKAEESCFCQ